MCPSKNLRTVCQGCKKVNHEQHIEISCPTARKQQFTIMSDCPHYKHEAISIDNFVCDACLQGIGWNVDMLTG